MVEIFVPSNSIMFYKSYFDGTTKNENCFNIPSHPSTLQNTSKSTDQPIAIDELPRPDLLNGHLPNKIDRHEHE